MIVAITNTKLRVMASAHSVTSELGVGYPQLDCLMVMSHMAGMNNADVTHKYSFKPLTTNKLYVSISPFTETDPNLLVTAPSTSTGIPRKWFVECV